MKARNPKLMMAAFALASLAGCQQAGEAGNQTTSANSTEGSASASGGAGGGTAQAKTIADAIGQSADHSTLGQALIAAGLDKTLAGAGPYTVFAPSNAAFEKLPAGTSEGLMRPDSKGALTGILTYHVVPGVVTAKDLAAAMKRRGGKTQLATVGGGALTATEANGAIVLADAKGGQARVTQGDMMQSNGVVHAIDAVLMPE